MSYILIYNVCYSKAYFHIYYDVAKTNMCVYGLPTDPNFWPWPLTFLWHF